MRARRTYTWPRWPAESNGGRRPGPPSHRASRSRPAAPASTPTPTSSLHSAGPGCPPSPAPRNRPASREPAPNNTPAVERVGRLLEKARTAARVDTDVPIPPYFRSHAGHRGGGSQPRGRRQRPQPVEDSRGRLPAPRAAHPLSGGARALRRAETLLHAVRHATRWPRPSSRRGRSSTGSARADSSSSCAIASEQCRGLVPGPPVRLHLLIDGASYHDAEWPRFHHPSVREGQSNWTVTRGEESASWESVSAWTAPSA
jgi:hypothetical protein